MTTLNKAFIRAYAKRQLDSQAVGAAIYSGPLGVQLRVDAGGEFSGAGMPVASFAALEPIHAAAGSPEIAVTVASESQIVASGETPSGAEQSNCLVGIESAGSTITWDQDRPSQHFAASCVKRPQYSEEIQWPSICQALTLAVPQSLTAAGKTLCQAVAEGMKTLAVTSAVSGVGATTTAICLAHAAAQEGIRVAVVDAHFASPQLAREMKLKTTSSWHEAAGESQAASLSARFEKEGVTFYPLRLHSAEDLTDWTRSAVAPSLHRIVESQDLVLLDIGPVLVAWGYGFSRIAEELVDSIILVRDRRQEDAFVADAAIDRLRRAGLEVVVAENFVS